MLSTEPGPFPRAIRSVIRTPDQRVRVFVSSTLGELADERAVVRSAIGRLRLSPVMFELGARPHPPRALYRAYLDQSHVFVGVYWQSYGWISPNETVSGIEDEYDAAGDRPKLIYVKDTAGPRDPRLEALLRRIERDDSACYKPFSTAEELRTLVEEDLALLLSERFEAPVEDPATEWRSPARAPLPSYPTTFVGREKAIRAVRALFARNHARIVTLTGPGGIGKTRLALEVARGLASQYDDGVLVVLLAAISDPGQVVEEHPQARRLLEALGLGEALNKALGTREGIVRFGNAAAPMDCALAFAAVDLVKRPYFKIDLKLRGKKVEEMPTEDIVHFYESLAQSLQANVHIFIEYGSNDHHKAEAASKAFALSIRQAVAIDPRRKGVPSSKGAI